MSFGEWLGWAIVFFVCIMYILFALWPWTPELNKALGPTRAWIRAFLVAWIYVPAFIIWVIIDKLTV